MNPITKLVLNAGYKTGTVDVYTSEDGENWTKHSSPSYDVAYSDVTIDFDTPVKYIKLDAVNQQIRIKSITATFEIPEPPCTHANTKVEGAAAADCTNPGHTGKTVCADCGELISEGEVINPTGHDYKDGVCSVCGGEDPDKEPGDGGDHTAVLGMTVVMVVAMSALAVLVIGKKKLF